jgi:hypothetical protein
MGRSERDVGGREDLSILMMWPLIFILMPYSDCDLVGRVSTGAARFGGKR